MLDMRANLGRVQEAVARACARAGRSPDHVLLIAVSKTMEVERVRLAIAAGVAHAELKRLHEMVAGLPALKVRGLMAIPPATEQPEQARPYFRRLRELRDELALEHCSMGMSADFEVAIEEGATMVRVGTAIFGARAPRGQERTG